MRSIKMFECPKCKTVCSERDEFDCVPLGTMGQGVYPFLYKIKCTCPECGFRFKETIEMRAVGYDIYDEDGKKLYDSDWEE